MKASLTLLVGTVLGVMVVLSLQQASSAFCRISLITLLPGVSQACMASQPGTANPPPKVVNVTAEKIEAVNKGVYAEMGIAVEIPRQVPDVVVFGKTLTEKTVTIEAYGTCQAGMDYEAQPARIEQSGTSVRITLPPSQVFPCSMTKIKYSVDGGIFGPNKDIYNQLFNEAYQELQRQGEQSKLSAVARGKAVREIELNTRRLGIDQVTVVIAKDASDEL